MESQTVDTPYVNEGEHVRCLTHGTRFLKGVESCPGCIENPGKPLDDIADDEPVIAPTECLSTVQVEQQFVAIAKELAADIQSIKRGKSREELDDDEADKPKTKPKRAVLDIHAYNTIAKLQAERVKALRAAGEYARAREDAELVARRERDRQARARSGDSH